MITFKQYLEEAVAKMVRVSMPKFVDMPDSEFNIFLTKLKSQKGILLPDTKIYSKLDGFPIKFGIDSEDTYFFETSSSGPKTIADFKKYTINKIAEQEKLKGKENARKEEMIKRGAAYDDVFNLIKELPVLEKIKSKYGNNFKIYAEVMFNKLGKETDKGIKFVSVSYDKAKLGKEITIFPYRVLEADTNSVHPKSAQIINDLLKSSNAIVKILPAKLEIKQDGINLSKLIRTIKDPQELKNAIADAILNAKEQIPDMYQIGDTIEGVVLWSNNKEWKITTKDFQDSKKAEKKK